MGNIESGEIESFWDNTVEIDRGAAEGADGSYYRDDESYRDDYRRREEEEEEEERPTAPASPAVIREKEEPAVAAPAPEAAVDSIAAVADSPSDAVVVGEITTEAVAAQDDQAAEASTTTTTTTRELNISSQKTNQVAPEATTTAVSGGTTEKVRESRGRFPVRDLPFALLFVVHVLLVTAGIVFLNILYLKDMSQRKLHNLERWFPQLGAAVVTGSVFASVCQTLFRHYPTLMARSIVWASSLLTFGAALMLISTSLPANLGVGIIFLIFSICQSLYACWVSNRIKYAGDLLFCSLNTAKKVPGTYLVSFWVLLVASVWLVFWSFGVVSALSFPLTPVVVLALLASLAWTLETLRNVVCTATARGVAALYLARDGEPRVQWDRSLHAAFTAWFGSICLGSLIVPILHVLRVVARGLNRIHGDNEFMFSCADCFYRVTNGFAKYANNWAYVQVAVHSKAFVKASKDTCSLFNSKQLDVVIDTDLTSSFCVLSGISGGMLCVLVSGGWTFGIHKALTSSVSIVSFFIGYFLVRLMMAVPQGAVCAHYVCYGENPASEEFLTSPVPERLKELLAEVDTEAAKQV